MKVALPVSFERKTIATTTTGETISDRGPMRMNYPVDSDYVNPDKDSLFIAMLDTSAEHLCDRFLNGRELSSLTIAISNVVINFQAIERKAYAIPDYSEEESDEEYGPGSSQNSMNCRFDISGIAENDEPVSASDEGGVGISFNSLEDMPDYKQLLRATVKSAFQHFWWMAMERETGPRSIKEVTVAIHDLKVVNSKARRS